MHVPQTNERRQLVILDKDGVTPEQIEARRIELAKLKVHPRDTEAISATLARAGRCYENAIGEMREYVGKLLLQFEQVLMGQDPRSCEAARLQLSEILDQVEGQALL